MHTLILIIFSQFFSPRSSWETFSFQPAEPSPDIPSCNDFHCSPKLLKFVEATNVKITLKGHTLSTHSDHQYFGIRRIVVGGG